MYNENSVDRSAVMKRRSTRHVSEITTIASEFGNSAKIIVYVVGLELRSFIQNISKKKIFSGEQRKDE
jgi:hypothetical protein